MQQKRRTKRSQTLEDVGSGFMSTMHNGMNYFHELNLTQFKIRKNKKIQSLHAKSAIQDTPIHELLQENKEKLTHILTEINDYREVEFNDYIKKSVRYQQLLDINENKKKHLSTNAKVGEVVKKSFQQIFPKNIVYSISIDQIKLNGWKPEARQGHTLTIYKDDAILIGGHCSHPYSTISSYSFTKNSWVKNISCDFARSYHSTILYKNRFAVVFGGMGHYNKSRKSRDCFNTIYLMDLLNNGIRSLKMHNQESVQPRRCHTATLLGRYMIIIGGINSKKEYLNDFVYLDLKELRWYHKQYRVQGKQFEQFYSFGIGKHATVSTFKPRKNYAFYSSDYQQTQALFCFGGFNGNQEPNIVFQLVLNKFIPTFRRVDFSGSPPSAVSPVVEWYNENSIILISGEASQREMRIFKVKQRSFIMVNQYSMMSLGGVGTSLSKYNDDYYLFYGLGEQGYSGQILKFKIQETIRESQAKKKKMLQRNLLRQTNYFSSDKSSLINGI